MDIHDVKLHQFWSFKYDPNQIYKLSRWVKKGSADIPMVVSVASYWTHEKEWKLNHGRSEENCNPYAQVVLRSLTFTVD